MSAHAHDRWISAISCTTSATALSFLFQAETSSRKVATKRLAIMPCRWRAEMHEGLASSTSNELEASKRAPVATQRSPPNHLNKHLVVFQRGKVILAHLDGAHLGAAAMQREDKADLGPGVLQLGQRLQQPRAVC